MLARVAERIYWMSRYFERAENTARLTNVTSQVLMDLPKSIEFGWQQLLIITGSQRQFDARYDDTNERNVLKFMITDLNYLGSITGSIQAARENARTIRDILPKEGWNRINNLFLEVKSQATTAVLRRRRHDFLDYVISNIQSVTGLLAGTMSHDDGYSILRLGRNLERADMTTRIVDVRSANLLPDVNNLLPYENLQWMSVLNSLSAYQAYRQKVQSAVRRNDVLAFLLKETDFPRSFSHCVAEVLKCLQELPRNDQASAFARTIIEKVKKTRLGKLDTAALHQYVDKLQLQMAELHNLINKNYFEAPG